MRRAVDVEGDLPVHPSIDMVHTMSYAVFATELGFCAMAWNESGLTAFELPAETKAVAGERIAKRDTESQASEPPGWVRGIIDRVQAHCAGRLQDFADVRLDWSCVDAFQRAVYERTQAIKPGQTRSYGQIARAAGLGPASARAVGVALGRNPWPLLVPCHRVISATGRMTGFSGPGGIRTKTRLLALEGAELFPD